jgi:ATP-dependent helicase/nuclease subunit A
MEYIIQDDPCVRIFETPQLAAIKDKNKNQPIAQLSYDLPEWAIQTIQPDPTPLKTLTPSRIDDDQLPVRSPLNKNDQSHRFQRGLLTHSLLQYLPDMEPETRIQAGQLYLTKKGHGVSPKIQKDILNEVMNILSNPDFAPYFGIHSQAEVPITGKVGNDIISGQIDRMLVTNDAIWIVDFKSNRPPPKQAKDVAPIYKQQLAAYKSLIKTIYQGHSIRTALLWTDGPYMMEI